MDKYITVTINKGKSINRTYQTIKVDKERLAMDIVAACNEHADKGYELISSTPIESGIFNHYADINSGWGFGASVTGGVVLIFKQI